MMTNEEYRKYYDQYVNGVKWQSKKGSGRHETMSFQEWKADFQELQREMPAEGVNYTSTELRRINKM